LNFLGALLIKHDERQILCREAEADAEQLFGKLIPVTISQTAKVNQSVALNVSVRMLERGNKVAMQYKDLAEYIDKETEGQGRRAEEVL
jgi:chromosome partitioning protein